MGNNFNIEDQLGAVTAGQISAGGGNLRESYVFVGNSIGTTTGSVTPYPTRISTRPRALQNTIVNNCVSGEALSTTITNFAARVGAYAQSTTGKPLVVHLGCAGGVDLVNGDSAATVFTRIQSFVTLCAALSPAPKVIIGTVCPGVAFAGAPDVQRLALNVLILADTSGTFVVHPMGEILKDNTDATFQGDTQHLSNIGHAIISDTFFQVLDGGYDTTFPAPLFSQLRVGDIAGGFKFGGIHFTSAAMGELTADFFLKQASGTNGYYIYNNAASQILSTLSTVGQLTLGGTDTGIVRQAAGVLRVTDGGTAVRGLLGGGASVASATALPLPTGRVFHVTGTTTITSITSTNFAAGATVTLIFDGILTFTDGNNLKLVGNMTTAANSTITLEYDGTNWFELARSAPG